MFMFNTATYQELLGCNHSKAYNWKTEWEGAEGWGGHIVMPAKTDTFRPRFLPEVRQPVAEHVLWCLGKRHKFRAKDKDATFGDHLWEGGSPEHGQPNTLNWPVLVVGKAVSLPLLASAIGNVATARWAINCPVLEKWNKYKNYEQPSDANQQETKKGQKMPQPEQ